MPRSLHARRNLPDLKVLDPRDRLDALVDAGFLDDEDAALLDDDRAAALDRLAESVIGAFPVPLGVARHFVIDDVPRLVALATEERSVIAAASKGAKLALPRGFTTDVSAATRVSGHVLFAGVGDAVSAAERIERAHDRIRDVMLSRDGPTTHGEGFLGMRCDTRTTRDRGQLLVVRLVADTGEAMGANKITRMAERLAEAVAPLVGRRHTAAICTNAGSGWRATATAEWPASLGETVIERVLDLQAWAESDPDRAVTHNKGIMNGVTAVCLATGQDTRAVEASAHAGACDPTYGPLTRYERTEGGGLRGTLSLWLPIGTKGGATSHPTADICRKLMGVTRTRELAAVCAAVGLAQNFAALRALADEGIPGSHERLAAR